MFIYACLSALYEDLLIIGHVSPERGSLRAAVFHLKERMSSENIWLCEIFEPQDKNEARFDLSACSIFHKHKSV